MECSPESEGVADGVEVVMHQLCEAGKHITGDGLEQLHHPQVFPNKTQDGQGGVGYHRQLQG